MAASTALSMLGSLQRKLGDLDRITGENRELNHETPMLDGQGRLCRLPVGEQLCASGDKSTFCTPGKDLIGVFGKVRKGLAG